MDEKQLAIRSLALIKKDLMLDKDSLPELVNDPAEELENFLTRQVQYLIDHDFGKLMNAMYRIDISEYHLKKILECSEPGDIARDLAQSIIKREQAKVITRRKYAN